MALWRGPTACCVVALSALAVGCGTAAHTTAANTVPAQAGPHPSRSAVASGSGVTGSARTGKPLWLQSVQMTSASDGWATSYSGNPDNPSVSPPLLLTRTSDDGQTWTDITPAGARPMLATSNASEVLDAVDGERAYFAVTASAEEGISAVNTTVLFATGDGGRTWAESAPLRTASQVGLLSFADARHGWLLLTEGAAMGQNPVQVYRTSDGGRHWSLAASSPPWNSDGGTGIPIACGKTGITFPTMTVGWLTSDCTATLPEALLVSRDGGVTWAVQALPVPLGRNGASAELSGPEFTHGIGFLTVGQYDSMPTLLVTADLGQTWRPVPLPAGVGPYPQVMFFSPADGVLVAAGSQGSLGDVFYTTSDGGQTWTAVRQGAHFTQLGVTIDFVSQRTGFAWILGTDTQGPSPPPMYETTNSGRTWTSFTPRLDS